MKIKSKVTVGVLALFGFIMTIGGVGLFYINRLATETGNILKDNYESVNYMKDILLAADQLAIDRVTAEKAMLLNLKAQKANITEPGEEELTEQLRSTIEYYLKHPSDSLYTEMRKCALAIEEVNLLAIRMKSDNAKRTANQATTYLIIVGSSIGLLALVLIVNFLATWQTP